MRERLLTTGVRWIFVIMIVIMKSIQQQHDLNSSLLSSDHRGTPERPGRTVTLCEDPASITWGVAYELDGSPEQQQATLSYLEWREKQYDVRCRTTLYSKDPSKSKPPSTEFSANDDSHEAAETVPNCLVYIAGPDLSRNANYLGPAPLEMIADQIATRTGPSGHNSEYLFKLAAAMRAMDVHDGELFSLEILVQERMANDYTNTTGV